MNINIVINIHVYVWVQYTENWRQAERASDWSNRQRV